MLGFNSGLKVYVAVEPCDMRKSFDGLSAQVRSHLQADPTSGAAFLFSNRKRSMIKILYWDGTGLWVVAKRLEKGTFRWPRPSEVNGKKISIKPTALSMLTDGIDLKDGMQRTWFEQD
jgi:transposase